MWHARPPDARYGTAPEEETRPVTEQAVATFALIRKVGPKHRHLHS